MDDHKLLLIKAEIINAAMDGQSSRQNNKFKDIEICFGFCAFYYWLIKGLDLSESEAEDFYEAANDTARAAAIEFVYESSTDKRITEKVKIKMPNFQPKEELALAQDTMFCMTHPEVWNDTLTRATIIICRSLAYKYVGLQGCYNFPDNTTFKDFILLGINWCDRTIDESVGRRIFPFD